MMDEVDVFKRAHHTYVGLSSSNRLPLFAGFAEKILIMSCSLSRGDSVPVVDDHLYFEEENHDGSTFSCEFISVDRALDMVACGVPVNNPYSINNFSPSSLGS